MSMHNRRDRCGRGLVRGLVAVTMAAVSFTLAAGTDLPRTFPGVDSPPPPVTSLIIRLENVEDEARPLTATAAADALAAVGQRTGVALTHVRFLGGGAQLARLESVAGVDMERARELARRVAREPAVEYAEPNGWMTIQFTPDDPRYGKQWHYHEEPAGIAADEAWDLVSGAGVVVAVVDTGALEHADLKDNLLPGYDMISDPGIANDGDSRDDDPTDPGDWAEFGDSCYSFEDEKRNHSSWHGTHVAGTVAALTDNGSGVAGVAWSARIVPVRVLGVCGGTFADIADGIRWAAGLKVPDTPLNGNPAQVINLSLGGFAQCGETMQRAISAASAVGATVVVAAGNYWSDVTGFSPANCDNVVTVAAMAKEGFAAWYSNYGLAVDVSAPGGELDDEFLNPTPEEGVLSTSNSGTTTAESDSYEFMIGTSMATPHVSAVAAMMYALNPRITPAEVETALRRGSREFVKYCYQCGDGMLDAPDAVLFGRLAGRLPAASP